MFTISKHATATGLLTTVVSLGACASAPDGPGGTASAAEVSSNLDLQSCRSPTLPSPTLAVPAGNKLGFFYDAAGVQIYACQATATGFGWVFQAPEATLFDRHGRVAGKHFAGPTWEGNDGSTVVGSKIAAFTVDPASVPWLLLQAASHTGAGRMSDVTFIQRLETSGGVAPATGCDADHAGDVARVDYTATYYFFEGTDGG
ncbi:MAG TPA: DUF3455 domain-containing protein [Polyangiaceae bacterium]|nr:DUF3455 domain-containing protein [Polyangiaceae bacterium]